MSWLASFGVALLTAIVGTIVSGVVASLAVSWYNISSFEGGSGYFVAGLALLGLIGGFLIGLIAARVVAAGAAPGFLKALGSAVGIVLLIAGVVGGTARLLADVPPEIDGEQLMLAVEVRWPASQQSSPATPDGGTLTLGSLAGNVQRISKKGMLWTQDAHQVDGRWVAPGAVEIFTTRGTLTLVAAIGGKDVRGLVLPLHGSPSRSDMQWTEWMPRARPGAAPLPDDFTYRYRVQKRSEPVRVEHIGPFDVATSIFYFFDEEIGGKTALSASARYAITLRGQPVAFDGKLSADDDATERFDHFDDVAELGGGRPALLVRAEPSASSGVCYVISDQDGQLHTTYVDECHGGIGAVELTSDAARFQAAQTREVRRGRVNRSSYVDGGLLLFNRAVLDAKDLSVRRFGAEEQGDVSLIPAVPPLALSPDRRSFVRFVNLDNTDQHRGLLVTDLATNARYTLPIDRARMRYATFEELDPAWLDHHFTWTRGGDGVDKLIERSEFTPLPYKGKLSIEYGNYHVYRLEPAGPPLRAAIVEWLVTELGAERLPAEADAYKIAVKLEGHAVDVAASTEFHYISISVPQTTTAPSTAEEGALIDSIGKRLDAALATRRFDALFEK